MQTQALTIFMDITVTSALNAAAMEGGLAASTPGTAAEQAEHNKRKKYNPQPVTPLVQEAHGRWGQEALTLLRKLTSTLPAAIISPLTANVMQQLSYVLQRENANAILNYIKTTPHVL
jgi:hypothetical protein